MPPIVVVLSVKVPGTASPASQNAITVPQASSEPPIAAIASRSSRARAMTVGGHEEGV